jgi:ribosome-associated toxin RatA of RatAB toxin-antitoxin module
MFDLVNDIERYPDFLPWCPKASIDAKQLDEIQATVHFAKGPLAHAFTTVNRLVPHKRVEMKLIKGPFRFLEGSWAFDEAPEGSHVRLTLAFEWTHPLLSLAVGPWFQHIAETMVEAFTRRARDVYA